VPIRIVIAEDNYLVREGVVRLLDGESEVGPGAILGERALLEGGTRTATLRALTKYTVAVARADQVDRAALEELSQDHRREESS
jgi:CRP-like cAMP-binding protein